MKKDLKSLIILFKAYNNVELQIKKSIECSGLSVNEFAAMEALYTKERLATQELIDLVLVPNSSMTYVLDTLTKKEYIQRVKCTIDKRRQYITLTTEGKAVFESIYEKHFKDMRQIFDVLTPEEEVKLQGYLKRIGKYSQENL